MYIPQAPRFLPFLQTVSSMADGPIRHDGDRVNKTNQSDPNLLPFIGILLSK